MEKIAIAQGPFDGVPQGVAVVQDLSPTAFALIGSTGSTSVAAADFGLSVTGAIPGGNGLFYYGLNAVQIPFGDGYRCIGGTTQRLGVINSGSDGILLPSG